MPQKGPDQTRPHIVSIQDSRPDGRLFEEAFRQDDADIELLTLYSVEKALDRLRDPARELPLLILLSAKFPTTTAADVLRSLKSDTRLRPIPVLVFGTYLFPEEIEELFAEQAGSVIEVPGDLAELERNVRLIKQYWLGIAGLPRLHALREPSHV